MSELVYDDKIGFYDPDEAFCPNHPGQNVPVVGEKINGMSIFPALADIVGDGGAMFDVELVCYDCLEAKNG